MNLLLAAKSGWGKSYMCQTLTEWNSDGGRDGDTGADSYDHVLVCDYKDEYRGLVSGQHGPSLARYWQAGEKERAAFGPSTYQEMLRANGNVVLARNPRLGPEGWREVVAAAVLAARRMDGSVLVVIDEAHFLAPQREGYPDPIKGLATTGRGEGASGMWVSQRLSEMDETVLAQCNARFLGGFASDADLSKIDGVVDYDSEVHRSGGHPATMPAELEAADAGAVTLRLFKEAGQVVGSEWVFSDDSGEMARVNSENYSMETEHVGAQGHSIDVGV